MIRCLAYASKAVFQSRARLVAENLCLQQQLVVLKRRQTTTPGCRSPLLASRLPLVFRMATAPDHRETGYGCRLASPGLESLLALAITPPFQNWTQED
ncbi:MAG: hypothetical protein OEU36_02620 [Gammaproteobacteria bacterium]|jgi:hypothetical protein|nr:hypothetical protein [Gammaproteobacteria bacterium]